MPFQQVMASIDRNTSSGSHHVMESEISYMSHVLNFIKPHSMLNLFFWTKNTSLEIPKLNWSVHSALQIDALSSSSMLLSLLGRFVTSLFPMFSPPFAGLVCFSFLLVLASSGFFAVSLLSFIFFYLFYHSQCFFNCRHSLREL